MYGTDNIPASTKVDAGTVKNDWQYLANTEVDTNSPLNETEYI